MSSLRPFGLSTWLAAPAVAALLMLTPVLQASAHAQAAQATPAPQQAASPTPASPSQTTVAATSPAAGEQRGLTSRAIDKVKQVAKSAGDIFSRVPCLSPKGSSKTMGSLPHVAGKLVAGKPVVIVAFGSSSTAGYGASSPDFN